MREHVFESKSPFLEIYRHGQSRAWIILHFHTFYLWNQLLVW